MDARQQAAVVARLRASGIIVSRAERHAGNLRRWEALTPEEIIHDWHARGLRVDITDGTVQAADRVLRILKEGD